MKTTWFITAYLRSNMPLTDKVMPVQALQFIVVSDTPPSDDEVRVLVEAHTRNSRIMMATVEQRDISAAELGLIWSVMDEHND